MPLLKSLRARLTAILLSLVLVPLGLTAWIIGKHSGETLAQQSLALQQSLVASVAADIAGFVGQRTNELQLLDKIVDLAHLDMAAQKDRLNQLLMHDRAYQELALLSASGQELLRLSRTTVYTQGGLRDRSASPEFVSLVRDRQTYFGATRFDAEIREPLLTIAVPIVEASSGALANALVAEVRFKRVWELLAGMDIPDTIDVSVVTSDGTVVAHRNPAVVLGLTRIAVPAADGAGVTASGADAIVARRVLQIGTQSLIVVGVQSRADALRPAAMNTLVIVVVTGAALAIAAILGLWLTRQTVRPLEMLARAARAVSDGDKSAGIEPLGSGEIRDLSVAFADMTARLRHAIAMLERSEFAEHEKALVTLKSIGDAVITTDALGTVEYLNPVAEQLTGWTLEQAQGRPLCDVFRIINEQTWEIADDPVARRLKEDKIIGLANHTVLLGRGGPERAIQDSAAPIRDRNGQILGVVLVFSDVTQARTLQNEVSFQASHDALTGLVNRREFESRLQRVFDSTRSERSCHALCYMDLDQFKLVNDACGHAAGDELLRQITAIFLRSVRHRDTVGRLGGDEFAVLMEHCQPEQALRVAHQLREAVEDYRFNWQGRSFSAGVSIGLVPINHASEDVGSVLRAADNACYVAKESGRNRVHVYREDDADLVRRHSEMQWTGAISHALEHDRFFLVAQPIVPVDGTRRERPHYELLLRLRDGREGAILPGAFLPAAERYNLATQIDRWVVRTVFTWLNDRPHNEHRSTWSINLSGQSMGEDTFLAFVLLQLKEKGVAPESICFEITETAAIANIDRATDFIRTLRARGCRFALDDFGSGLSSFAYLKILPVDYLKIDGLFVRDIEIDSVDRSMVRAIHEVGHLMGMKTVAEFVENDAILHRLREMGVDYAQGFGISAPVPLADIRGG